MLRKRHLTLLLSFALGATRPAIAGMQVTCPVINHEEVYLVSIYDGKPSEEVSLASDDDERTPDLYTLGHIYDAGRSVTIRCTYKSGAVHDIELKQKVQACRTSRGKTGKLRFNCQ
ncbi:MAG TPA: hypothetical protein PLN02_14015 [Azonexus sp.]|nr:hypothetical protein [Azonexus sp.]